MVLKMAEYIDRKLLKKCFKKRLDWLKKDIQDEYSGALYDCCEVDTDLIDEIPAADVAPVVHGQWILRHIGAGHYWECSVCHTNPCIYVTEHTKFCPNCGARMDEGED